MCPNRTLPAQATAPWLLLRCASLLALLAFALLPGALFGDDVRLGRLGLAEEVQGQRAMALETLAQELSGRTSTEASFSQEPVFATTEQLFRHPFLVLPLKTPLPALSQEDLQLLGTWLQKGGTLLIDYSGEVADVKDFLRSIYDLTATLLPGSALEPVPAGSIIYRSFYRLRYPAGRIRLFSELYGAVHQGRLAVVVSLNDLLGALEKSRSGEWRFKVVPGGETQRESALRLAVNIISYALCLDYKNDKVHLEYLRARRNFRLEEDRMAPEKGGENP